MLILPVQGAQYAVAQYPHKLNVISVDRESPPEIKSNSKNHLQLDIDDLNQDEPLHRQAAAERGYRFATKEDILAAIDFAKKHKVHVIHCGAGVSRSPAIAYAIFRSQGMTKDAAMKAVMDINPYAEPNKWIVKLVDELFGQ